MSVRECWHWMVLGRLLMRAEMAIPAFFVIWFGIAAAGVGLILLAAPEIACQRSALCGTAPTGHQAFPDLSATPRREVSRSLRATTTFSPGEIQ